MSIPVIAAEATSTPTRPAAPTPPLSSPPLLVAPDELPLRADNLPAIFNMAATLHEDGYLDTARALYRRILRHDQSHVGALRMLGVLHLQLGAPRRAVRLLRRAVPLAPGDASIVSDLGECYRSLLRFDDAVHCYQRALEIDPDDRAACRNLSHASLQAGRPAEAVTGYGRLLAEDPEDTEILTCLGVALGRLGEQKVAADCYRRILELKPDDGTARHLLAAATGEVTAAAPASYVTSLFDEYANAFEEHLVGALGYRVPELLRTAIDRTTDRDFARVLDLGCGTGLAGAAFRDRAGRLEGVDLSQAMLNRAADRGIYDDLQREDLIAALTRPTEPYDLILAADVLIYLGDLGPVFAAVARTISQGGIFAFSTERARREAVELQTCGRYAHAEHEMRCLAANVGLDVVRVEHITVRIEERRRVRGQLFILRRPEHG